MAAKPQRRWWMAGTVVLALAVGVAWAEITHADAGAEAQRMQAVVAACKVSAEACQSSRVATDETVKAEGAKAGLTLAWGWLRDALDEAAKAKEADRRTAMDEAVARLEEIETQVSEAGAARSQTEFAKAHDEAARVLTGKEFQHAVPENWVDRLKDRMWMVLGRMFDGVGRGIDHMPWLGTVLEWGLLLGAAVGLVVFLQRSLARQRLAISLGTGAVLLSGWDKESADWSEMAERCAAAGEWREAVHCLYWAGIVRLESRRAWRHNPARTPREYVRLLKEGSAQQEALRGLTQILERVWYGLREASHEDYERARALFEGLSVSAASGAKSA